MLLIWEDNLWLRERFYEKPYINAQLIIYGDFGISFSYKTWGRKDIVIHTYVVN